jgi:MFS family permease
MTDRETSEITPQSVAVFGSALVGASLNGATVAMTVIAVFLGQVNKDYGWSHATIGGAVSFLYLGMAISAPSFGWAVDRYGPRAIALPLTLLSGLLLASFSVGGGSLLLFYSAHLLLGMAQTAAVAHSKLLSTWFFRRRGIALTVIGIGTFIAQIAMPPLARLLMERFGWQNAYVAFGAAELLISYPILFAFFRERKAPAAGFDVSLIERAESSEVRPDGAPPIRFRNAVTGRRYWRLLAAQVGITIAFLGVATHGVGILRERGLDPITAVWGLSTFALGGLIAQIIAGYLLDRFDTPRVIVPFAVLTLLSLLLLQFGQGKQIILAAVFLFGFGCSACTPISYFTTRYFGVRNFSAIYGSMIPFMVVLAGGAPVLFGKIFDFTGSYGWALIAGDITIAASTVFFMLLDPYPYPDKEPKDESLLHDSSAPMSTSSVEAF